MENVDKPDKKGTPILSLLRKAPFWRDRFHSESDLTQELDPAQEEMIRGVLDLSTMNVRDVMIPRIDIIGIKAESKLKDIISLISDQGHSRLPVYTDTIDNISGILYAKDLLRYIIEKPKKFDVLSIIHKPLFIPETMPLDELLIEFRKKRQHLAVAVDEYGGVSGLVSLENILEEIVGEINDEYDDPEKAKIVKKGKNEYELDARLPLTEVNARIGTSLPTENFGSIGGYVLNLFGRVPDKGEEIVASKYLFKVKEIRGTRMQRILMTITKGSQ
ncbi:MAG TPA: hemolysin family protein [Spirochaetota bacterium]